MKERNREDYLRQHPDLQRWINTCVICGKAGHKPEMRDEQFHAGIEAVILRKLFEELRLTNSGLCPDCSIMTERDP